MEREYKYHSTLDEYSCAKCLITENTDGKAADYTFDHRSQQMFISALKQVGEEWEEKVVRDGVLGSKHYNLYLNSGDDYPCATIVIFSTTFSSLFIRANSPEDRLKIENTILENVLKHFHPEDHKPLLQDQMAMAVV